MVRYNLSINDGIREYPTKRQGWFSPTFHISGPCENTRIHHNVIIIPEKRLPEIDSTVVHFHNWGGPWPIGTRFEHNLFLSPRSSGFHSGSDEGTMYSGNGYFGRFDSLPDDAAPVNDPAAIPAAEEWGEGFRVLKAFLETKQLPDLDSAIPAAGLLGDLF